MSNTVTVNGNSYNDGNVGPGNMGNGGHRANLLPMLSDAVVDLAAKVAAAGTQATNSANSAAAAATSATSAVNAPGTNATSTTTLTIGTGSQTLTIQTGKNIVVGVQIMCANTAAPTNWMAGTVTAYNSGTGALTFTASSLNGTAVGVSTWTLAIIGAPGIAGTLNELRGADLASAAAPDIWNVSGNYLHMTGTATVTGFPNAPTQGARRRIYAAGAFQLASGANLLVKGGNYTCAVGDEFDVVADTITTFSVTLFPKSGLAAVSTGIGGSAVNVGNTSLVFNSPAAQAILTTAYGQYVTLPDATTCIKSEGTFGIANIGDFPLGVKDNTGNQLGWIPPRQAISAGLADQASAAGVWVLPGTVKVAVTASFINTTLTAVSVGTASRIALDANRTLHLFGSNAGASLYAVVYDASSQTWGAVTTIAIATGWGAMLSAANQVIVGYVNNSTSFKAFTLTIAGTAITVNGSPATFVVAGIPTACQFQVVQLGATFVFAFPRAGSVHSVIAATISGTTCTLGIENALNAGYSAQPQCYMSLYAVSATVGVLTSSQPATNAIVVKPFTISAGTTITGGTAVTLTTNSTADTFRSGVLGGYWYLLYPYSGALYASIVTISGSIATASSIALVGVLGLNNVYTNTDVTVLTNKLLVSGPIDGGNNFRSNILSNTAGVASAGTEQVFPFYASMSSALVYTSGNVSKYVVMSSSTSHLMSVDASGASPVVTMIDYTTLQLAIPQNSNWMGARNGSVLSNGASWYCMSGVNSPSGNASQFWPSNWNNVNDVGTSTKIAPPSVAGANANETWALYPVISATYGILIQRIECAA